MRGATEARRGVLPKQQVATLEGERGVCAVSMAAVLRELTKRDEGGTHPVRFGVRRRFWTEIEP
jgi:hypothetical protein